MDFLQLAGKPVLVFGVANRKSVAYHTGRVLQEAGADVLYAVRSEKRRESVQKLVGDAPVYVCDVAEAAARAVDGALDAGTYELGGPEIKSFRDCLEDMLAVARRNRSLLPIPFAIASAMGKVFQVLPMAPFTADQVELLKTDNVVSDTARAEGRTLEGIGIDPATLAAILPTYLERYREHGQYDAHRPA